MSLPSSRYFLPFLLGVIAAFTGCARENSGGPSAPALAPVVARLAVVQREVAPVLIETSGTVRPIERAQIAAKISGVIETLSLTLGQTVKRGDLLARLASPELTARLAQVRAQLEQAEREETRDRELAATGANSTDAARASAERLRAARATVAEAEGMLAYTEIHAPYDGRVAQKLAYTGDLATPGQLLLVLESSAALQVEVAVPASLASAIKVGVDLPVQISGVATTFRCPVAEIAAAADPATRTVLMKLTLPSTDSALSGRAARVTLAGQPAESLLVPATTLSNFGQMERAFVVIGGKAQMRIVRSGARHGDRVEILSGLSAGEQVVLAPPPTLRDGTPVTPQP